MARSDKYERKFSELANAGEFFYDYRIDTMNTLKFFKREIAKLREDGFTVTPSHDSRNEVPCFVDWSYPFYNLLDEDTTEALMAYVNGCSVNIPTGLNFAQRLYAIATRSNKNKN